MKLWELEAAYRELGDGGIIEFMKALTGEQREQLDNEITQVIGAITFPWDTIAENLAPTYNALLMRLGAIGTFVRESGQGWSGSKQ